LPTCVGVRVAEGSLSEWFRLRRRHLLALSQGIGGGLVDPDVIDLLAVLNSCWRMVTVSSCSGRIIVLAAPSPKDKKGARVLGKWHRRVTLEELNRALESLPAAVESRYLWLSVQPPIITLYVYGWLFASRLVSLAERAGFKYSGLKPFQGNVVYVSILGTVRLDIPLKYDGEILAAPSPTLIHMINDYLYLAKSTLVRLKRLVLSDPLITECMLKSSPSFHLISAEDIGGCGGSGIVEGCLT